MIEAVQIVNSSSLIRLLAALGRQSALFFCICWSELLVFNEYLKGAYRKAGNGTFSGACSDRTNRMSLN